MFQKKILTSFFLALIFIGGFFANITLNTGVSMGGASGVYAQGTVNTPGTPSQQKKNETTDNAVNTLAKGLNSLFQILSIIAVPAIVMASWLMSPDWTSGDMFNLRDTMYQLWVTVSNVIYFVYAVLLIIIAIGTILGNEKFGYKAMLPRLALGIIMVPFTWWFVQWTISLATVITASVITIPADIVNLEDNSYAKSLMIPKKWVITADSTEIDEATRKNIEQCEGQGNSNCISFMEAYESVGGIYGSLLYYAQGVFQISKIQKASFDVNGLKSLGQLANELIIGALFFIVFGILVIALVFMLLMRAIKLWMYAIFSPLFTVHFVLGKDTLGEKMGDFNLKEFIGLCFVPAVVGITLSFGLVVISAIKGVKPSENINCTEKNCRVTLFGVSKNYIQTELKDDGNTKQTITTVKMGELETVFNGKAYPTDASGGNTAQNISKGLNVLGPLFGTIVIDIIALIFIWAAFMAAKGTSKAVAKAIDPFEKLGTSIGGLASKLPQYMPLPIPGGSVAGTQKAINQLGAIPEQLSDKRFKESNTGKFIQSLDPSTKLSKEQEERIRKAMGDISTQQGIKQMFDIKKDASGSQNLYNSDIKKLTEKALENKESFKKAIDSSGYNSAIRGKMNSIIDSKELTNEEKDILITALIKGYDVSKINDDLKKSTTGAKTYLTNASGGTANTSVGTVGAGANTVVPKTESGKVTEITVNNNGTHVWKVGDLKQENIAKIAEQLRGSGITKEKLDSALKGTDLEKYTEELLKKIKELEEKK